MARSQSTRSSQRISDLRDAARRIWWAAILKENAQITRDILSGKIKGAKRNAVVLNAAACIYIAGKADSIADGIKVAENVIDSGKAAETLDAFVRLTNE